MQSSLLWPGMKRPLTQNAFLESNQTYAKSNLECSLRESWISSPWHQSWYCTEAIPLPKYSTFENPSGFKCATRVYTPSSPTIDGFKSSVDFEARSDSTAIQKRSPFWRLNRNVSSYSGFIPGDPFVQCVMSCCPRV